MPIAHYEVKPGKLGCTGTLALLFLVQIALVAIFFRDWLIAGLAVFLTYHFCRGSRWAWWVVGAGFLANAALLWWQLYQGPHDWAQLSLDIKVFKLPQLIFPMIFFGELRERFRGEPDRVQTTPGPGGEGLAGVGARLKPMPPTRPMGYEAPMPPRDGDESQ